MTFPSPLWLVVGCTLFSCSAFAQSTWTGANTGAWEDPANWQGGAPPANSAAADAVLTGSSNTAITVPEDWSLGWLTFDVAAGDFTFGGASLNLANGLNVFAGNHTFTNSLLLGDDAQVNVQGGATVTLSGGGAGFLDINAASGASGTVILAGATSFATIYVEAGRLQVNAATSAAQLSVFGDATAELNTTGAFSNGLIALMDSGRLVLNAADAFTGTSVWFYSAPGGTGGTIDLNGHAQTINADLSFSVGGSAAESGWFVNSAPNATTLTFDLVGTHTFFGNTSNAGGGALSIVKAGCGTLVLGTAADDEWDEPGSMLAHTGATTINAGTLIVNGNLTASTVTVNAGGTLAGVGTLRDVVVESGGTIIAQDYGAVGTMTVENLTLAAGSTFSFYLTDAAASAGTGWTFIDVSNVLSLPSTAGSITLSIAAGDFDTSAVPLNFNPAQSYSFTIARFGSMTGFFPSAFTLLGGDASVFSGGTWSLSQSGNELHLNYAAIPEPGTCAALAGLLMLGTVAWRRRRRHGA